MPLHTQHDSEAHTEIPRKWVSSLLVSYWLIVGVHFAAQLISFQFLPYDVTASHFYRYILIQPTMIMSSCILLAHYVFHKREQYTIHCLLFTATIIAIYIIHVNADIRIITALFLLPILVSVIFFNFRLTVFSTALQLIGFVVLYFADSGFRAYLTAFDLIAIPIYICLAAFIASVIMIRGKEILSELQSTLVAKQDLMVRNAMIDKLAKTDALTELYNHISFHEYYDRAIDFARNGAAFQLALLDIDNFKRVNDTYGHRIGDLILKRVARVIEDNKGLNNIAARYGGEEFALLLFETSLEEALLLVEKIREIIASTQHSELEYAAVTVSIGLRSCSSELSKELLFEQVDAYLYHAKRTGKNKTVTSISNTSPI